MNAPSLRPVRERPRGLGMLVAAVLIVLTVIALASWEVKRTAPLRDAIGVFYRLVAAANRGDVSAARGLCSERLQAKLDRTGDKASLFAQLPRSLHKNYQVWLKDGEVWLCPTNREGVVFRFRRAGDDWLFDGPVALMGAGGELGPLPPGVSAGPDAAVTATKSGD